MFLKKDISDFDQVSTSMNEVEKRFGKLDILYNNASVYFGWKDNIFTENDLEIWHKVLSSNLNELFYCCKAVFR